MNNNWHNIDGMFDLDALRAEIKQGVEKRKPKTAVEIPAGHYEVAVEKLELTVTKTTQRPMVSGWFRIRDGEHAGRIIFYSQVVSEGWQILMANRFLDSLGSRIEISFDCYEQYASLINEVFMSIADKYTYELSYSKNSRGYSEYVIIQKFDEEGAASDPIEPIDVNKIGDNTISLIDQLNADKQDNTEQESRDRRRQERMEEIREEWLRANGNKEERQVIQDLPGQQKLFADGSPFDENPF